MPPHDHSPHDGATEASDALRRQIHVLESIAADESATRQERLQALTLLAELARDGGRKHAKKQAKKHGHREHHDHPVGKHAAKKGGKKGAKKAAKRVPGRDEPRRLRESRDTGALHAPAGPRRLGSGG